MCNSIDDGFGNNVAGNLVVHGRGWPGRPRADGAGDLGHHEVHGLIHLVKECALVDLVRRNRLLNCRAMKMSALDFSRNEGPESLRVRTEQQNGAVGRFTVGEQVQMSEHFIGWRVF